MMRFKSFINENTTSKFNLDKFIKKCQPFLDEIKGISERHLAWRGAKAGVIDYKIDSPKTLRRPRDTDIEIHNFANKFFYEKFGWRAREFGIFVTGDYASAKTYGEVYAIFPIGKFKSLWSPDIIDLTTAYLKELDKLNITMKYSDLNFNFAERDRLRKKHTLELIKNSTWHYNTLLKEGLQSGNEIIIQCDNYYQFLFSGDTYFYVLKPWLIEQKIIIPI